MRASAPARGSAGAGIGICQVALARSEPRLVRILRLGVFIASSGEFQRQGAVANGASNLLVNALGEKGRHVRTAVGVSSLPAGVAVEVDAIFELQP